MLNEPTHIFIAAVICWLNFMIIDLLFKLPESGGVIEIGGNAGHYCASGYRGEKHGMRGGHVEVMGNAGDFCSEYLTGGEVHIHGSCGDMAGVEMKGGQLIIEGDAIRPCGNMKDGMCMIFGTVHRMLPTFEKIDTKKLPDRNVTVTVYKGDVANRGKGMLMIKNQMMRETVIPQTQCRVLQPRNF